MITAGYAHGDPDLLIEKDPIVNTYVSVPKDKSSLNCAAFIGGILEAILNDANFVSQPVQVARNCHFSRAKSPFTGTAARRT